MYEVGQLMQVFAARQLSLCLSFYVYTGDMFCPFLKQYDVCHRHVQLETCLLINMCHHYSLLDSRTVKLCLTLYLWYTFSALTLLVGRQEGYTV